MNSPITLTVSDYDYAAEGAPINLRRTQVTVSLDDTVETLTNAVASTGLSHLPMNLLWAGKRLNKQATLRDEGFSLNMERSFFNVGVSAIH